MSKQKNTIHAFDFLKQKRKELSSRIVVFGDDSFLKELVLDSIRRSLLGGDENDINLVKISGQQAELNDISDELHTISLFGGGGPRVVLVDEADAFVAKCRNPDNNEKPLDENTKKRRKKSGSDKSKKLEELLESESQSGVLILDVKQWASNTRLYKIVDKSGLQIDCRVPSTEAKIAKWASSWAKSQHGIRIQPAVIEYMLELTGTEMGILDQNLAKLALYFDDQSEVTEDAIDEFVGGWQTKTIWQIIESMIDGRTGTALSQLNRLFQNGEVPQALYGQISWAIRRYALSFDEAQRYRRSGRRPNVDEILAQAGFKPYETKKAVERLGRIGRKKGADYYRLLLDCDLELKGSHSKMPRARIALESLLLALLDKEKSSR